METKFRCCVFFSSEFHTQGNKLKFFFLERLNVDSMPPSNLIEASVTNRFKLY